MAHRFSPASVRRLRWLAGISAITVATPAFAQDVPAEEATGNTIIVTATKRDQTIQDVPFSINAQTADDIQKDVYWETDQPQRTSEGRIFFNSVK